MPTILKAGNASSGYSMTPGGDGELEIKTGSGAGTTALTIDASQNTTLAGDLQVAGVTTNMYPLVQGTAQTAPFTAPNTSCDFSGISSWAKRITVIFSGVSTNGTNNWLIQVGQVGSVNVETSGYLCSTSQFGTVVSTSQFTAGFGLTYNLAAAVSSGSLTLENVSGNIWVASGIFANTDSAATRIIAGNITLSSALDRVRITTVGGANTFDAGTINIMWE